MFYFSNKPFQIRKIRVLITDERNFTRYKLENLNNGVYELSLSQITVYLEQKFFKELRAERFGSVKVVMAIYRKVICSCQEQL
jgi:hypothetical protein